MAESNYPSDQPEQVAPSSSEEEPERVFLDRLLSEIRFILTHNYSLQENLQRFAEAVVRHLDAAFARIWLLDEASKELELVASAGMYTRLNGLYSHIPFGELKIGNIARSHQPHLTNSVIGDTQVENQEWAKQEGMISFAGYPLIAQDRTVGVIGLFARHPLSKATLTTLSIVADGIAWNIERVQNTQLLEIRVAQRTEQLATLLEISRNIASTIELKPLLSLIVEQLKKIVDYDGACFYILEGDKLQILENPPSTEALAVINQPYTCFPVETIGAIWNRITEGEVVIIHDLRKASNYSLSFQNYASPDLKEKLENTRALLAVPLEVKGRPIGMLLLSHSQAGYFTERQADLVRGIARQAALALVNARLYEQAQEAAAIQERQRLARNLHDSVTQSLFSLTLLIEAGRRQLQNDKLAQFEGLFDLLGETAYKSLKEVRLLAYQLRLPLLEQEGLAGALKLRLDAVEKRSGVEPRLILEGDTSTLPLEWEENLYGIVVEALNNVLKHSRAKAVTVRLKVTKRMVSLEIRDKGVGFNPALLKDSGGLGMTSMRQRAALMGGSFTIKSLPTQGTTVRVKINRA
ncbi:MAG: GAF domain-containing sensor histidine kinase [Chloroflexi bacterium]|nr:GAF domain-containing sensor histidine kinase [Chloroflexota bacterium]OJV88241.1 MAG: hypothetical protein BGO39_08625 [Chloroflexi bacterium 54-19]